MKLYFYRIRKIRVSESRAKVGSSSGYGRSVVARYGKIVFLQESEFLDKLFLNANWVIVFRGYSEVLNT